MNLLGDKLDIILDKILLSYCMDDLEPSASLIDELFDELLFKVDNNLNSCLRNPTENQATYQLTILTL